MSRCSHRTNNLLFLLRYWPVLLIVALHGCSHRDYQLADVKGRITRGGNPAQGLNVTFQPVAKSAENPNPGPPSYGFTDADGRYSLRTITDDLPGAVVGQQRVSVRIVKKESTSDAADRIIDTTIPSKFRDGSITLEVPAAGLPSADFDLPPP